MALEHLFPSILSSFFSFAVGTFILLKGKTKVNLLFAIFCYGLFIQSLFAGFLYIADNPVGALQLDLISVVGILIAIASFIHFTLEFNNIQKWKKKILSINYGIAFFFLILNFTGKIFESAALDETGYYGVAGKLFGVFFGYVFLSLIYSAIVFIYSFFKTKDKTQKLRIKYILISTLILGISALIDMARKLDLFFITNIDLTRFGIFIFLIGISYTIVKFKMLNINIALKKSFIFSMAMVITALLYVVIQEFFEKYFKLIFGTALGNASIVAALVIAFFFDKIRKWTARILGVIFFIVFKKEIKKKGRKKKKKILYEMKKELTKVISKEKIKEKI